MKSVGGLAAGSQVKASAPDCESLLWLSAPSLPRYHERACVPGGGKLLKECRKPSIGAPGCHPAPLSKRTLTDGERSNAASAEA